MTIKEYLEKYRLTNNQFADICDLNYRTMRSYLHRIQDPTLSNAFVISCATNGEVTLEDMLKTALLDKDDNMVSVKKPLKRIQEACAKKRKEWIKKNSAKNVAPKTKKAVELLKAS